MLLIEQSFAKFVSFTVRFIWGCIQIDYLCNKLNVVQHDDPYF